MREMVTVQNPVGVITKSLISRGFEPYLYKSYSKPFLERDTFISSTKN